MIAYGFYFFPRSKGDIFVLRGKLIAQFFLAFIKQSPPNTVLVNSCLHICQLGVQTAILEQNGNFYAQAKYKKKSNKKKFGPQRTRRRKQA